MKKILMNVVMVLCLTCLNACAKTAEDYYKSGDKYLTAGNYKEAIVAYQHAIQIDSKNIEAYTGLVSAYKLSGQDDKYLETLQQFVENIPECNIQVYIDLSNAYLQNNDTEQYTATLQSAIDNSSDTDAQSYIDLANIFRENNDIASYLKTLKTGYNKTKDDSIQSMIDDAYTVKDKDLEAVYNQLLNSGMFVEYMSGMELINDQCNYIKGFSKNPDALSIEMNKHLSDPIDGKYTRIWYRVYIEQSAFSKHYYAFVEAGLRGGETDEKNYTISYTEKDNGTTALGINGPGQTNTYNFVAGKILSKEVDPEISTVFDKVHIDLIINYADEALKPLGMSFDNIFDRNVLYNCTVYYS